MPIILKEDINSLNRNVSFHDYEKRDPSIISKNSSKKSIAIAEAMAMALANENMEAIAIATTRAR